MTINFHSIPGMNQVVLLAEGSNFLRSVELGYQTECLVCEAHPIHVSLTFASTRSEYTLLTGLLGPFPNFPSPGPYFDWAYRCSG